MKKSLLFAAALVVSAVASAQTVTWPSTITKADKSANLKATVEGSSTITASDIAFGTDLAIGQKDGANATVSIKDQDGTNVNYPTDTESMIPYRPTAGNVDGSENTADKAEAAGAYIDLVVEEADIEKDLAGLTSIDFDVTKVGTDAIRVNAKLIGEGDDNVTSDWLINETVAKSFGDDYTADQATKENEDGSISATNKDYPWDALVNGYNPSRNDGSKGVAGGANSKGYSHVTLAMPAAVKAVNPYKLTLRIVCANCANNKDLGICNIVMKFGGEAGISAVTTTKANANAPIYNLAGQQVNKNYKGVVIQNGKKFIQ